jgi:hypothetical protein
MKLIPGRCLIKAWLGGGSGPSQKGGQRQRVSSCAHTIRVVQSLAITTIEGLKSSPEWSRTQRRRTVELTRSVVGLIIEVEKLIRVIFEPSEIKPVVQEARGCLSDPLHDSRIFFADVQV